MTDTLPQPEALPHGEKSERDSPALSCEPRDPHFTLEDFHEFIEADPGEIHNRLLFHHLAVCRQCYKTAGYILDLYRTGKISLDFGQLDLYLEQSRAEAPALYSELEKLPAAGQKKAIRSARFHGWGLVELLCEQSFEQSREDPERARGLAELAVLIAAEIKEEEVAELGWVAQLRAYAWAHLGHTRNACRDSLSAAEAFERAAAWQEVGKDVGDVLDYEERISVLSSGRGKLRLGP